MTLQIGHKTRNSKTFSLAAQQKKKKMQKKMDLEIMQQLKNLINCVLFYAASAIFHPTARGNIANMRADLTSNLD